MNRLRLASPEEIDSIRPRADLDFAKAIYAKDNPKGPPHLAVLRLAPEVDPAFFAEGTDTRNRVSFIRDLETALWAQGLAAYYFTADQQDSEWATIVQHWGAQPLFATPHQRYKKIL